jgi:RNA polymerase sigma factor (sigma-70 family)
MSLADPSERPVAALPAPGDDPRLIELRPLVVRTVRLVVGAGSLIAEDAAQEALVELSRSLPQLRDPEAAHAFAAKIAARVAIKVARRERRFAFLGLRASDAASLVAAQQQPPELVELKEAFDSLPPRQRATTVLRLYVGLNEQETAAALGCSVGTVKRQLHDARKTLTAYLGDETQARISMEETT